VGPPNDITPVRDARSALLLCVARAVGSIERDRHSLCEKSGGDEQKHKKSGSRIRDLDQIAKW